MLKYSDPIDAMFHALADPSRRGMIDRLSRGPASVTQLATMLAITLAAVVQHLKVLEESGLVRTEKVGRVRSASLEPGAFTHVEKWIAERRTTWEQRYDRLAAVLDDNPTHPHKETP